MILAVAVATSAFAAETRAESMHDRWASMNDLSVETALVRPIEKPVTLTLGPEKLELSQGWVIPVFSGHLAGEWERRGSALLADQKEGDAPRLPSPEERGDQVIVGFVWTRGTGELTVPLDDRADALVLANRMVLDLGEERSTWAPIARGEAPVTAGVADVIVLGIDPRITAVFLDEEHPDPYEIVVYGDSAEARSAAAHAKEVFQGRLAMWDRAERDDELDRRARLNTAEIDRGGRIAWDRIALEHAAVAPDGTYTVWDVATTRRWGLVSPAVGGESDRWLTVVRDTTGLVDQRREIRVSAMAIGASGDFVDELVAGVPYPPSVPDDPTSPPLPTRRVDPVLAETTVLVTSIAAGNDISVKVDSRLTLRAVGGPAAWIDMALPRIDRVPGSFRIATAELEDGTPLLGREPQRVGSDTEGPNPDPPPPDAEEFDPDAPDDPAFVRFRLLLPEPVPEGQTVVIHLVHEDTWPCNQFTYGRSSGPQGFLPRVAPQQLSPVWPFRARVAVPYSSKLVAAMSGRTVQEGEQGGWWVTHVDSEDQPAYFPALGVGWMQTIDDPAQLGFPAVRVRTFTSHFGTNEQFAPEIRRIIGFYEGWLPPFPVREVEVFEGPRAMNYLAWTAPYGMAQIQVMLSSRNIQEPLTLRRDTRRIGTNPRNDLPHFENGLVAHEIAHQYWGHLAPPASIDDFWISESFSELFACLYLSAAFDAQDCRVRMADKREDAEALPHTSKPGDIGRQPLSLTGAYTSVLQPTIVYDYGPYVLGEMLIRRIGREPFFGAMDVMLREHAHEPLTTERLQAYLEAASGKDLEEFFDFWVHMGRLPAVSLSWEQKGSVVSGTVTSDVPFGTFDVPVVVQTGDTATTAWVVVTDGSGTFRVDTHQSEDAKPALDPEGYILARKRSTQQVR